MLDVQQVMRSVIGNALSLTATQVGTILLWDQETKRYMITGAAHPENSAAKVILSKIDGEAEVEPGGENQIVSLWCELTAQVMTAGQPLIVTPTGYPVEETERVVETIWVEPALPSGLRAVLGVPIQIQNQPSGAIFVGSLVLRSYNTHDVQLLSFVANQAAVAISNARLVQRLNLFNEELERRVEQRTGELAKTLQDLTEERDRVGTLYQITRELAASFDLDRMLTEALSLLNRAIGISQGTILLLDHDSGHLVYRAALGRDRPLPRGGLKTPFKLGFGLAGKVMEERQPRLVPDLPAEPDWITGEDTTANRRSALAIPLITGEEVLGALMLFHPDVNYFNEDHLKLVTAAGAQVATAINNAELYRLITDQAERLGVMLRTQAAEAAKNQAILRGITDGVLVLDAMRNIVLINPKAAGILNIEAAALENQHIRQILGRSESPVELELTQLFYDNLLKALSEIESGERSAEFRVEGAHKAIVVTMAPVALGSETATSIVAVIRDISREAEIERLKNEFISTVSHELRTPMTSIKGYADLLVAGSTQVGALNPTQERFVRVIQSNANRLTELVNDILEISRIETGRVKLEFEALDVTKIIRDTAVSFEGQRVKKPMHLSLDLPEGLPNVYADRARLTQILVNLIANAWQYTPEDGHITVRASKFDEHFVQIDVEDSGIGIVEKDIDYIFDRFFRSERPEVQVVDGTGLGLSITRMYIEMMGGKIWVKSTLDVGSTFSFTVSTEPEVALIQGALVDTVRLPKRPHVLIIDDDPAIVQLLKSLLEKKGYLVLSPPTPQDALSIARHASKVLALIMLDVLLKNADGFKLLEQLSEDETTASIPMIVTSLSMDENGQELAVDVVDYIATSFEEAQVLESVQIALGLDPENADQVKDDSRVALKNRVLVVDSNRNTVQWLTDALDASGYEVHRAFNSQQALDMAFNSRPDLMLINANMVDNQGETIISQLRQVAESKEIPIIAVTDAVTPAQDGNRITVLGKKSRIFTRQPFTPDILALELAEVSSNTVPAKIE
jgi:signal transduction histidine kinase/DNA-binding response OmpR family regulator